MPFPTATLALTALFSQLVFAQQFVMYSANNKVTNDDPSVQRIDPILAPGHISQHVHQVFGASGLSSDMTYDSLQQSSCTNVGSAAFKGNAFDNSVYWHPALFANASDGSGYIRIPTNGHKLYYKNAGSEKDTKREPFEFPHGFRMLAGNPFNRTASSGLQAQNITQWICHDTSGTNQGTDGGFPKHVKNCDAVDGFNGAIHFPHCWNGNDFDPQNPGAHVVYPNGDIENGVCPSSHPTRLPHIFMENTFNIDKVYDKIVQDSFVLAQGDNTGYGWHADFFNGWVDGAIPALLESCATTPGAGGNANEDVGGCAYFQARSIAASACNMTTEFVEEVTKPGPNLPGCNPIIDTTPAPIQPVAPLGIATNVCTGYTPVSGGSVGGGSSASSAAAQSSSTPSAAASSASSPSMETPSTSATPSTSSATPISGTPGLSVVVPTTLYSAPSMFGGMTTLATFASSSAVQTASSSSSSAPACPAGDGTTYTTNGVTFLIECGINHDAGDMSSTTASSFGECISACATTPGCVDVSFMGNGCYLKKTLGAAQSNKIVNGAKVVSSGSASSSTTSSAPPAMTSPPMYNNAYNDAVRVTEYDFVTTQVTQWVHRRHAHRHNGYDF